MQQSPELSVLEAVRRVGISRSAFYKYKDVAKPFYSAVHGHIVTLALTLSHRRGALSEVLSVLTRLRANILTINQSLPLQGLATVIVSAETREMETDIEFAIEELRLLPGVHKAVLVGQG